MARNPTMPSKALAVALQKTAFSIDGFTPARDVFQPIRSVKTRLISFNAATRVNGFPLQRVVMVHGPSNEGKTTFVLTVAASFIDAGSPVMYNDAERTLDDKFPALIMGPETARSDLFFGSKPATYEEAMDNARKWLQAVSAARAKGQLPADGGALMIVDSLRKLTPAGLASKVAAGVTKNGVDGVGGRAGQVRAAYTAAWLDELVPLLDAHNASIIMIVRESEDPDADANDKKYGNDYKVTGGKAVFFDSSLVVRIERAGWIGPKKEGEAQVVYGERHVGTIRKTKLGGKDGKNSKFYFCTANGLVSAAGLDPCRDAFDVALKAGLIKKSSSWLSEPEIGQAQGEYAFLALLRESPHRDAFIARVAAWLEAEHASTPDGVIDGDQ